MNDIASQTITPPPQDLLHTDDDGWNVDESANLYGIDRWGQGYFGVNEHGHVEVYPDQNAARHIDLLQLVDELQQRDIQVPILLRFNDVLRHRVQEMHRVFDSAMRDNDYRGGYRCVYPIKVNQQRQVVEKVLEYGRPYQFGVEAGSKPELLAVMAMVDDSTTPIICNGFKDDEYLEAVVLAAKIGKLIIPVVEKFSEIEPLIRYAQLHDVRPRIGLRVKLAARGAGRWQESGGVRSKFGLFPGEVLQAAKFLEKHDMLGCLKLLHFHLGSQINNIQNIKKGITEAARVYVELQKTGAQLEYIDVGGGLGVDYNGTQSSEESSINYTLQEYANDIVYYIKEVCDHAQVAHPTIISESGRALTAYHSVLVFNVLGANAIDDQAMPERPTQQELSEMPQPVRHLFVAYSEMTAANLRESYHDAQLAWEETLNLFNLGYCTLEQRVAGDRLYVAVCRKALHLTADMDDPPAEMTGLDAFLADTYFCNLSIFQSLPDSWAIDQLFPIMPIHRLGEQPTRGGILADITCDSDGKIDHFINRRSPKHALELHPFSEDEPYYIAVFLVGAYQEILGDLHNLFGDTNAVHVSIDENNEPVIEEVVEGDTVREVLEYVQFSADELRRAMRRRIERAVREKKLTIAESRLLLRFYEDGLAGYTYLE